MFLCEANFTFAIYAVYFNNYLYAEKNRVVGLLGGQVQKIIDSRKGYPYLCKLVATPKTGEKQMNSSYDGAIGLIERKVSFGFFFCNFTLK